METTSVVGLQSIKTAKGQPAQRGTFMSRETHIVRGGCQSVHALIMNLDVKDELNHNFNLITGHVL